MNERYEKDLREGLKFQDHAMRLFYEQKGIPLMFFSSVANQVHVGENLNGVEIKYDRRFRQTGNLYIETRERSSPTSQWHEAGITKQDNSWAFAIGDYDLIYVFAVKQLRWLWNMNKYHRVKTDTSEGFLLPVLPDAERWAIFTLKKEGEGEGK